jgi:hypothetical protein
MGMGTIIGKLFTKATVNEPRAIVRPVGKVVFDNFKACWKEQRHGTQHSCSSSIKTTY